MSQEYPPVLSQNVSETKSDHILFCLKKHPSPVLSHKLSESTSLPSVSSQNVSKIESILNHIPCAVSRSIKHNHYPVLSQEISERHPSCPSCLTNEIKPRIVLPVPSQKLNQTYTIHPVLSQELEESHPYTLSCLVSEINQTYTIHSVLSQEVSESHPSPLSRLVSEIKSNLHHIPCPVSIIVKKSPPSCLVSQI